MTKTINTRLSELENCSDQDQQDRIFVNWRTDDMIAWPLDDGSTELITKEEYKARGGVIITWADIDDPDERIW